MSEACSAGRVRGMTKPEDRETALVELPTVAAEIERLKGVRRLAADMPGPCGWWAQAWAVEGERSLTVFFCRSHGQALLASWLLGPTCNVRKALPANLDGENGYLLAAEDKPNFGIPVDLAVN